jgi:YD repeat-containing protein
MRRAVTGGPEGSGGEVRQDIQAARDAYVAGHDLTVHNYYSAGAGEPGPTAADAAERTEKPEGGTVGESAERDEIGWKAFQLAPPYTRLVPIRRPRRSRRRRHVAAAGAGIAVAVTILFSLLASPSSSSRPPRPPSSLIPLTVQEGASRVRQATNLIYDATFTCPQLIQDVAISARDGIACFDGNSGGGEGISLWRAAAPGKQLAVIPVSNINGPGGLAISPNDDLLAFGDSSGNVYVWNVITGKVNSVYTDQGSGIIDAVAFSPDGNSIAEGDDAGEVYIWNLKAHKQTGLFIDRNEMSSIQAVTYDPNGKMLAITDDDGSIYAWKPPTDQPWHSFTNSVQPSLADPLNSVSMNAAAFSPSGTILAVTQADGVELWNVISNKRIAVLSPDGIDPTVAAFSPNGATLAVSTDGDSRIYLISMATLQVTKVVSTFVPAANGWGGLEFSPDGKYLLAYAQRSNEIYLYRVEYSGS